MRKPGTRKSFYLVLVLTLVCLSTMGQAGVQYDLPKPKKFENRKLGYEKTYTTKMNFFRKFTQNTYTHYNYHFNAYNKLNDVIELAKMTHQEDYRELLSFYNYSLETTAAQDVDLDSVVDKCNAGILLHDLRNAWDDNLFLIMGKSYFFQQEFDTAIGIFQYVNYYFQEREKGEEGTRKDIGSNENTVNGQFSISTKEKKDLYNSKIKVPPSRNDAIIWLARTLIETENYGEAAGLIETLKRDPLFPERLQPSLAELQAYWYYRNNLWDSSAAYLIKALPNAQNAQEKARWEFLIAQMYEKAGKNNLAGDYFEKVMIHTTDLVMEVYARLYRIRVAPSGTYDQLLKEYIEALLKLAKQSKYENYRDLIYVSAARMELQRKRPDAALELYHKALGYAQENPNMENDIFLEMGEVAFQLKDYEVAYFCLDSTDLTNPQLKNGPELQERRDILQQVVFNRRVVTRQDSLQRIAAFEPKDRETYVKKLSKELRKAKGLKEEEATASAGSTAGRKRDEPDDLFGKTGGKSGDWYFSNLTQKSRGFTEFNSTWGRRPNVDNWRRQSALSNIALGATDDNRNASDSNAGGNGDPLSFETMLANLPLDPDAIQMSNDSIAEALHTLGKLFKDRLEDCDESTKAFEDLLRRFPSTSYKEEALFDLYYCNMKLNRVDKARLVQQSMEREYPQSELTRIIQDPRGMQKAYNEPDKKITKTYDEVYNLFIEGDFQKALAEKKKADSLYGTTRWNPQLLYIESVYHIKQRDDSAAIKSLNAIIDQDPGSAMAGKAATMIDVLRRRNEIEGYLKSSTIEREKEEIVVVPDEPVKGKAADIAKTDKKVDAPKAGVPAPVPVNVTLPEKVIVGEKAGVEKTDTKPVSERVTAKVPPAPTLTDTLSRKNTEKPSPEGFTFRAEDPQYVLVLLNKVDIVYANETRIAFQRYNRDKYATIPIDVVNKKWDDIYTVVQIGPFADALTALSYIEKARPAAPKEIVTWLPASKYSFLMVSDANYNILQQQKNWEAYRSFLKSKVPGKF